MELLVSGFPSSGTQGVHTSGRGPKSFRTKGLAESFLSDMRQAAKRGEAFELETGLPESMIKAKNARTWLQFAQAYVLTKWPHSAAKSREGMTEGVHPEAWTPAVMRRAAL